jgi:hypothetical protein
MVTIEPAGVQVLVDPIINLLTVRAPRAEAAE